jgi:hypothetical protein
MRLTRSNRERQTDALLSLTLLNLCASQTGIIGDRLKVTKLLFLATYRLFSNQARAFNFSFYRYHHGPFTTELYETWGELSWMGFLEVPAGPSGELCLTEKGIAAAKRYEQRLLELDNEWVLQEFRHIADRYCQLDTHDLLKQVYSMELTPLGWQRQTRISEVPMGTYFTCILDSDEAVRSLAIDDTIANAFFNEIPRAVRPQSMSDAAYREIYASAVKGVLAEKAGLPSLAVSRSEIEQKLRGGG